MRDFVMLSMVLVATLSAVAWWRGGDHPRADAVAPSALVAPPAVAPPVANAPVAAAKAAPPREPTAAEPPRVDGRADSEVQELNRLRAEAADAVHSSEEM